MTYFPLVLKFLFVIACVVFYYYPILTLHDKAHFFQAIIIYLSFWFSNMNIN